MIDIKEVLETCTKQNLQFEEYCFLNGLYTCEEHVNDTEFIQLFNLYRTKFQYYHRNGGGGTPILWVTMVNKLIEEGWIDDFRSPLVKKSDIINAKDISSLKISDKFKSLFLNTEKDKFWGYFIGMFQDFADKEILRSGDFTYNVINTNYSIFLGDSNNPKVKDLMAMKDFWWVTLCGNGVPSKVDNFLTTTHAYLEKHGANIKIANYLLQYKSLFPDKK